MKLLNSHQIGNLRLENRLVFLATHLGYCAEDGFVTEQLIEFYRERARHKPGLIVVGGCYTERYGSSGPSMIGISTDEHIEGLSNLTDTIHDYGVPAAAQLYHAGRYVHSIFLGEQAVSASAVPCRLTKETPRPLEIEEIKETIANFGSAASRAKKARFDAVEILGSAGYIINQFMAKATNKREDEYGGNLRSRARFAIEVVESVRESVGPKFPILYRISGEDFVPGGNTLEDNKKVAPWLVEAGVDCINVTGGWHETRTPQITMDVPRGSYAYLAEGIAESVDVPVIACNRISSPTIAERILERGKASLIGMSRGFIADPEIAAKIREKRYSEIRTCIGCNIGCLDKVFLLQPVTCAINPLAGYETTKNIGPPGRGRIAVVGAGAAGLESARVLSSRRFTVTLFEEETRPGGLLNVAANVPGRGEFAAYVSHMWREMRRLDVELRLGISVDADDLVDEGFDAVVCSNGTLPTAPPIDGVELPHVISASEVIAAPPKELRRVVVIGGGALGCYAALKIAGQAKSVEIFEKKAVLGEDLGRTTRWVILKRLKEKGVKVHLEEEVEQILSSYIQVYSDEDVALTKTSIVVVASNPRPDTRLHEELETRGVNSTLIGSAAGSKGLLEVVHGAFEAANKLDI